MSVRSFKPPLQIGHVTQTDVTDPRRSVRRVTFNAKGYTLTNTEAYGQAIAQTSTYEWQANTNLLLSVTDALNRKTAYTYDSLGRRTGETPNSATTHFVYDGLNAV